MNYEIKEYYLSKNAPGHAVQPVIIILDCSTSFEKYRNTVNDALCALFKRLKNDPRQTGKDIYITLIIFNLSDTVLYEFKYVKDIDNDDAPIKRCESATDIGKVLKKAIEIGQQQYQCLKEKEIERYKPIYYLFSDMENNPGSDRTPESEKSFPARSQKLQENFEEVAVTVKGLVDKSKLSFVVCLLEEKEDVFYDIRRAMANAEALTVEGNIFHIHKDLSEKETNERIIHFLNETISQSSSSLQFEDALKDEQKYFSSEDDSNL